LTRTTDLILIRDAL